MTILPSGVRHAFRRWRHRPGVAVTAILVLSLGIGATTAMYSIVDAVLLKAEPWPDAERLVRIFAVQPLQRTNPSYEKTWNRGPISWQSWRDLQKAQAFADVAVWVPDQQIVGDERTELVRAFFASSSLPLLVGAQPLHGRLFNADEDEADSGSVILSHKVWMRLFGGDPNVIGTVTSVTPPGGSAASKTYRRTIVGVLPEEFSFPGETPDVLIPIGFHKYNGSFGNAFFHAMARLNGGATVAAAAASAEPLVRREESPDRRTSRLVTLRTDRIGLGDQPLWLMLAAAGLLLVVACANVAGLLLSDARSRHHETAVRLSLGGTRAAILRSLLGEHLVLAIAAAAGGVLVAQWMIPSLVALAPPGLVGDQPIGLDNRIAAWSIAGAVLTTLLAGLIPSAAISSARPGDALKLGARQATGGSRWRHRLVVAAQFGVALVLLVGAGLFGETLLRLDREPLGFDPGGVAVVGLAQARQAARAPRTPQEQAQFDELRRTNINALMALVMGREWAPMQTMLDSVSATTGVRAAAYADSVPFAPGTPRALRLRAEGQPETEAAPVFHYFVTKQYFDALGIAVRQGRTFEADFDLGGTRLPPSGTVSRRPVVVSQTLARRLHGGDAIGRNLVAGKATYEVIGVADDVKQRGVLDDDTAAVYMLLADARSARYLVARTTQSASAMLPTLRGAVEEHRVMFPSSSWALQDLVNETLVVEKSRAILSSAYGLVALLLASVGLYGLAARLVAERRREIGIRVALGAGRRDVRALVMADAWMIVGLGLIVGLPSAFAAARVTQGMLFGVAPTAPHVLGIAAVTLTIAAVTATLVPVWRANRIDPAVTLRDE
jgi:hypothetical protein